MVLLATFASMRWGELVGLRRENIDLDAGQIRIVETTAEWTGAACCPNPKSRTGRRTVTFRSSWRPSCAGIWSGSRRRGSGAWSSPGRRGAPLSRSKFRLIWNAACGQTGMPGLQFHDLRHVGGTLAAATGASLKELMARLGHSSARAAMIYQHATRDRDLAIAKALGGLGQQVPMTSATGADEAGGDVSFWPAVARVWPDCRRPASARPDGCSVLPR